jgi:membrane-bound lytic murein transglycosylase D
LLLFCALAMGPSAARASADDAVFPLPRGLEKNVAMWQRIYLEVTTSAGLLHDDEELDVVYEVVRVGGEGSSKRRQSIVDARRRHWKSVLSGLRRAGEPRSEDERTAAGLWRAALGRAPTATDYARAEQQIRFQLGQADKFRAGVIRSGAWEDAMRAVFRERGLPEDLAFLPHVESSFNLQAYSKYGAAGVWQFMRSTGKRYMRIDYAVDERLDPMIATHAAARLLEANYQVLGSWPLAVTAYNHGAGGMQRAKRQLGTDDLGVIARRYQSRSFGFASRNFYAQFYAARRIMHDWATHLGPLHREEPEPVDEVVLPFYTDVHSLQRHLGVSPEVIREYNPSLRPPVFRSAKRIPQGYRLRVPAGTVARDSGTWLAAIPRVERHEEQPRPHYYQVRKGDTLSRVAKRHDTTVEALVAQNGIGRKQRIFPGQVLELPDTRPPEPVSAPSLVATAHAAALPAPARAPVVPAPQPGLAAAAPVLPELPDDSPWRRVDGDFVIVDSLETLGHFAEWLEIPIGRLRELNRLTAGRGIEMGARLQLDFSRVSPERLLERRIEFHKGVEEDFLSSYRIAGTADHTTTAGDNVWVIANQRYGVPAWLIHRFNPQVDLAHLAPGTPLVIPVIEPVAPDEG